MGDPDGPVALEQMIGVAAAVLLEGAAVGVKFPAVELDDEASGGPERVDRVAIDEDVGLSLRQALGRDEGREPVLQRRVGVTDIALLREEEWPDALAGASASRTALVDGGDLAEAEEVQPVGFVPGALEALWFGAFGEVEERARDRGGRDTDVNDAFVAFELAAVEANCRPPGPPLPPTWRRHVHRQAVPGHAP
jgi:hypothetical protein